MEEEDRPMEQDSSSENSEDEEEDEREDRERVYLPTQESNGERLDCDMSVYVMYHQAGTVAPCLSFDIMPDHLGDNRTDFPHTIYLACGTQSASSHLNRLLVMKMTDMNETRPDKDQNSDSDDESDNEPDSKSDSSKLPKLHTLMVNHQGCVNRLRVNASSRRYLAATWSELGSVHIWDLTQHYQALESSSSEKHFQRQSEDTKPVFSFAGHQIEGYALDWSPVSHGFLASGDCNKNIHIWKPQEDSSFIVDQRPLVGHTASVEDIQWSPSEASVLASCSVDRSIRIWDIRAAPSKACMLKVEGAHDQDVNVLSWNRTDPFLVSGGDDGHIKIWDLRELQKGQPVATFKHHTGAITSVEWHPTDSSVFAASGSDDQLTLWDLSVERDPESGTEESDETKVLPPQLLFIHQGQNDIKELHWHRQIPGTIVSTALSDFNVFKTISV